MRKLSVKSALIAGGSVLVVSGTVLVMSLPAYAIASISSTPAQIAASTRLDQAKLRICTARETAIDSILRRVADRGNRHLTLIGDVAAKTETFYTSSGKTLSNYDSLLATVNADKTAAQAAIDQVKTDSTSFKCDGADPHGTLQAFKNHVAAEVSALKDYKLSTKNLVDGVKSVAGGSQ